MKPRRKLETLEEYKIRQTKESVSNLLWVGGGFLFIVSIMLLVTLL